MMARVLLANELGDGLGHVGRLLPIASALAGQGVEVLLAVREPVLARPLLARAGLAMVQAPFAPPVNDIRKTGGQVAAFGDILGIYGWQDQERLAGLVAGWDGLLGLFRPDLIVLDFAPILALAAYGRIPLVNVGSGYTLPPTDADRFPAFRDVPGWTEESSLLTAAQAVQETAGRPRPPVLPAILRGHAFVTSLPMFDPYLAFRRETALGPLAPLPAPVTTAPETGYFAYLSGGYAGTPVVLEALAQSGLRGSVFLRTPPSEMLTAFRARGLLIHDTPQPLARAAGRASVVIHHAGLGTSESVLAIGRPQLLVPRHIEQLLTAQALGRAGVATMLQTAARFEPVNVLAALRVLLQRPAFQAAARQQAAALAAAGPFHGLDRVLRTCHDLLGKNGASP